MSGYTFISVVMYAEHASIVFIKVTLYFVQVNGRGTLRNGRSTLIFTQVHRQWRREDVRGPWTTDSPGPLPILHDLIPLTHPPHRTYPVPSDCERRATPNKRPIETCAKT